MLKAPVFTTTWESLGRLYHLHRCTVESRNNVPPVITNFLFFLRSMGNRILWCWCGASINKCQLVYSFPFFHWKNNVTTSKKDCLLNNTYDLTISCLHLKILCIIIYIIAHHFIMVTFYFIILWWSNLIISHLLNL